MRILTLVTLGAIGLAGAGCALAVSWRRHQHLIRCPRDQQPRMVTFEGTTLWPRRWLKVDSCGVPGVAGERPACGQQCLQDEFYSPARHLHIAHEVARCQPGRRP